MQKRRIAILTAFAAFALAAKAPTAPEPARTIAEKIASPSPIAPAASTPDRGCSAGKEVRSSDLCAQWKAADAANRAVTWAMVSTLIAAIGASGLLWQIHLTRRALKETGDATLAMLEANEISRNSNRGYLAVIVKNVAHTMRGGKSRKCAEVHVHNIGKADCLLSSFTWAWRDKRPSAIDEVVLTGPMRSEMIPAGETVVLGYVTGETAQSIEEYLIGVVKYRTTLNADQRTHFVYEVQGEHAVDRKPKDWPADT